MKVKFEESFKDGMIFGGKNYRVGEIADITAEQINQARRSGAVITVVKEPVIEKPKVEKKVETKS